MGRNLCERKNEPETEHYGDAGRPECGTGSVPADGHGGGAEAGKTTAGGWAVGLSFAHQAAVGIATGGVGVAAEVEGLAEWAAVGGIFVEAPVISIR